MCLGLLAALSSEAGASITVRDDFGRTVSLERPARRVIALYGAFNEILAALGREEVIVARTNTDRRPESIIDKPSIGTHMRPNLELVLGHKPDLVLQMSGRSQASEPVTALAGFGLNVAMFEASSFEQLFSVIERVGILVGAENEAAGLVARMKERLRAAAALAPPEAPGPKVFYEVRYPNLLGAGRGSIVNDIIVHAGGENCVTSPKKLIRLSEEELLRLSPEVYLMQKGAMNPNPVPLDQRPHFRTLPPAQSGRFHIVDEQIFSRPGPRNVDAVESLAGILFPREAEAAAGAAQ